MRRQTVSARDRDRRSGLTLAELLVATTVGLVVLGGIGAMTINRVRLEQDFRRHAAALAPGYFDALEAMRHVGKSLERADRVNVISDGLEPPTPPPPMNVQIRIPELRTACADGSSCTDGTPDACCYDVTGNYRWVQYRRDGPANTLLFFDDIPQAGPCPAARTLASYITGGTISYEDRAGQPAVGGEPFASGRYAGDDNNVLGYTLTWDAGAGVSRTLVSEVTLRGAGYTNLRSGSAPGDSGSALDSNGISGPPLAPGGC
jgi:hypothetical protein